MKYEKFDNPPAYDGTDVAEQQYPPPQYSEQTQEHAPQQFPPQQFPPQQYQPQAYEGGQYAQQIIVIQDQPAPPTNQVLAWISCLCFFWPLGCLALSKAFESDKCAGRGDMEGARVAGESARKWAITAIIVGIVLGIVVGISRVVIALNAS